MTGSRRHSHGTIRQRPWACATLAIILISGGGLSAAAQDYRTPQRGSEARTNILDALRPLAAWAFAPPVEFVVEDLRVSGDVAFAAVSAQRPGGGEINVAESPIVTRDEEAAELVDGPRIRALLQKSGDMWVPVDYAVGPTDVWESWTGYCAVWSAVLPEYCTPE